MATVLSAHSTHELSSDPALEKVNSEQGVDYARQRFGERLRQSSNGLKVESTFCPADGRTPFETVKWELRSAAIKDESGNVLFEQHDCEIPATWSQLATNVVVSKYFYGDPKNPGERETQRPSAGPSRHPHDHRLGTGGRLL